MVAPGHYWLLQDVTGCCSTHTGCNWATTCYCWALLVAPGRYWLLRDAAGCSRTLLVAPGRYWLLQDATGCSRTLLVAAGCCWMLLAGAGCYRLLLDTTWLLNSYTTGCFSGCRLQLQTIVAIANDTMPLLGKFGHAETYPNATDQ